MSERDYELIVRVIRRYKAGLRGSSNDRLLLARSFADEMADTYPTFDPERFIAACTDIET